MIEFIGWAVVFCIVFAVAVRLPVIGFIVSVGIAIGFNPVFWIIPALMILAFVYSWFELKKQGRV